MVLGINALSTHAAYVPDEDTAGGVQGTFPSDYSQKTEAELYAADRELRNMLGKEPGNAAYYFELANVDAAIFDRTRKQKASGEWLWRSQEALEKVVMLDPENKIAHFNLGVVYKRQGWMERAREQLKKGLALCRGDEDGVMAATYWLQIGETYEVQGFYEEAQEAYLKAREYDYTNEDVSGMLSDLRAKMKSADERGDSSPISFSPAMQGGMTAAGMAGDPVASGQNQNQAIGQALPYLGQMLANKFSGGDSGGDTGGP